MRTRTKESLARSVLAAAGLLAGFGLVEGVLRLAGFSHRNFLVPDDEMGFKLCPGEEGWFVSEGGSYVRVNQDGWRDDREYGKKKPANTFRVAVLGDSFTQAVHVPVPGTFWKLLEARLNACQAFGRRRVEVLNFGVGGYTTAPELLTLRKRVWGYSPDLVILAFYPGNDVNDNSKALTIMKRRPFFFYRDGKLSLDDSFRELPGYRFRAGWMGRGLRAVLIRCRTLQFLHQGVSRLIIRRQERARGEDSLCQAAGCNTFIYSEPRTREWEEAWKVTEGLLCLMRQEVEARGASFLLVTLSDPIQVHPNPETREAFLQRIGAKDLFYVERRIEALGKKAGISTLTLAPALQAHAWRHGVFLHGFGNTAWGRGHWNELGHELAARLIAARLCPRR